MMLLKPYRINIEAMLKSFILAGFSIFFIIIIHSGKAQLYVHPRIVPYMKFGIAAMILIFLFTISDIFKSSKKTNLMPYIFFIIPLMMAFTVPAKSMDSKSMPAGTFKPAGPANGVPDSNVLSQKTSEKPAAIYTDYSLDMELSVEGDSITINDNNFYSWIQKLNYDSSEFEGKKIQMTGFVLKNKDFKEDEFVAARFMMSCCTADLQPVGLICHYEKASMLKNDRWLKVTGTIRRAEYQGNQTSVIEVEDVEKVEKPENEYIYP